MADVPAVSVSSTSVAPLIVGWPVAGLFTGAASVVTAKGGVAFQGRPPSGSW